MTSHGEMHYTPICVYKGSFAFSPCSAFFCSVGFVHCSACVNWLASKMGHRHPPTDVLAPKAAPCEQSIAFPAACATNPTCGYLTLFRSRIWTFTPGDEDRHVAARIASRFNILRRFVPRHRSPARCVSEGRVVPMQRENKLGSSMRIALSSHRDQLYVLSHCVVV
jgi:hypothetical protein